MQATATPLVTQFPCDSRAMWQPCRRTALCGPLAATQTHLPLSRQARSYPSGSYPVRKWHARNAWTSFDVELASFGGVPDPRWRRMTVGRARSAVRWRNHGGTCQGIVPCDVFHYRTATRFCPDRRHGACWIAAGRERAGRGARLDQWVEKGFDPNQIAGGDHSVGSHPTYTNVQIRHHTRSRASVRSGSSGWLRGVEGKG